MSAGRTNDSITSNRGVTTHPAARSAWCVVLVGVVLCGAWGSHAADDSPAAGLRGIFPNYVPADLTATIASLPDTWSEWGTGLTADLSTLYEKEGLDVAGQRQAIAALEARLKTVKTSLADSKYKSITSQLVTLQGGLRRRIDLAKAILDTLELGPQVKATRVDSARQQVAGAASDLDRYLGKVKGGEGWARYLQVSDVRGKLSDDSNSVATLTAVQTRLKGKESLEDEKARDFLAKPQFTAYETAVDEYLSVAALPADSASPELRKALTDLVTAIEDYELGRSSAASAAVRKAFDAIRGLAPDGGSLVSKALQTNYLNYNVRVIATEGFLSRLISETRMETGGVRDCILGADVSGCQTTLTSVSVNLVPSATVAMFDIVANGTINSNTVGSTDQADVYTLGNHSFSAAKRIVTNGDSFWTEPARINVTARNTTVGATTNFSWVPLLGMIADNIAVSKAEELRGESEAIARSRVRDNVLPRFNAEIDSQFGPGGSVNNDAGARLAALQALKLYPDAKAYSTTEDELRVSARLMADGELGASEPNHSLVLGRGATILVHESLLNNAADRLDLKGQTLTDDQLAAKLEENLTQLLGRPVKFKDDKAQPNEESDKSLIFDTADPIRFQVTDGSLVLTLRAGLRQEGKEDIPTEIINIPLSFSVDSKNVVIEPGSVSIEAAEKGANAATQGVRAGVIKKKIEAAFPRREIDRVKFIERQGKRVLVAVTRIKALDGWLSITFE